MSANRRSERNQKDRSNSPTGDTKPAESDDKQNTGPTNATSGIPVIGLGGSAGALDSFKVFFEAMPADSGAAFVVIQHLPPDHESLLPELLGQRTRMKVTQAQDGTPAEPNCVYIIPPNRDLGIRDGILYLTESVKHGGIRMPIDFFFRSLAEDRQERAVCILLSGAGSDGTLGVRAVRGAGGLTLAQDPQTAQYGDMPRSAIATRLVDCVLPPDQMPAVITNYLRQPYVRGGEPSAVLESEGRPGGFTDILAIVRNQTGCDFRCYKKSTILRRIERRMGLHRIADVAEYSRLLSRDAGEVGQLLKDLLINVTAFFRDAEAFEELRLRVIAPLVAAKQAEEPLRIWVTGCASGEEPYSLAMLLMEEMAAARKTCPLQVFATDIDEDALQFARQGIYPESVAADVGPDRLSRFFIRRDQGYQIAQALRNSVIFAAQNLITDPPFSKMDLISCRNLLIYLDTDTQSKLIPLFNFALNPGGCLFLGKSEGVSGQNDLFSLVSKQARLYRRLTPARPVVLDSPILPGKKKALPSTGTAVKTPATTYADTIRQTLLGHFSASVVLVGAKGQIVQFHGQTGKYLDMPVSEPNLNLLDIAKEGLSLRLRSALHTALDEGKTVVMEPVPIMRQDGAPCARVTVTPIARRGDAEPLLAVIFEEMPRPAIVGVEMAASDSGDSNVRQLEDELRATQQDLQSSIEELQASNEEMRISNEEVVSSNEELQSTNEELETSKEELQSVNEELTTVNSQLQEKVEQLDTAYGDMANLLQSTQIATLFLDSELRIKFFTPATTRVLKLIPADMGRPISDLHLSFVDYDLTADARAIAQGSPVIEQDVRHTDGSCYTVRILPYQSAHDRKDGVVVTFDDVTRLRRAEERTRRLATVVTDSNDAVILFDTNGGVQAWNRGAQRLYGWTEAEALSMNIRDPMPAEKAAEMSHLIRRMQAGETVDSFETQRHTKDGRLLDVWVTATALRNEAGRLTAIATTERDVTERKLTTREHELTVEFLRLMNAAKGTADLVHAAASFFHERSGCEAVGIRIKTGDDYPYSEAHGFPEEFVRHENSLCARDSAGNVLRDSAGYPIQECMCGTVIQGRFDASKPFFSARGSFWSNGTTELLASTNDADRQTRTRNRCNGEGYESVALIALRAGEDRLGLLQLNDKRKNRFSPGLIALWERLADYLAVALAKTRAEEALHESEAHYRSLFENMLNGFAYCRMEFDQERAHDFIYVTVNKAFQTLTGLNDVVGRRVTEVIPGIRETNPQLLEAYGRVTRTGVPETFETYLEALKMWFAISVYRPAPGHFVAVFDVITERKRAEEALRASERRVREIVESIKDGFFALSNDWRLSYVNQRAATNLGLTPEGMIGKNIWEVFPHILGTVQETQYRKAMSERVPVVFELEGLMTPRWYEIRCYPTVDGISVFCVDITGRKKAEKEILRRSEELRAANDELSRFNRAMVDRELRMIELKKQVNELYAKEGRPPAYDVEFDKNSH